MPTTRAPSNRTRSTARFSRTGTTAATPRRHGIAGGWIQRRQPPKRSAAHRAMDAVKGAIPGAGATGGRKRSHAPSSKKRRGGKAGGIALVTATAGMAFKNRGKLMDMLGRGGDRHNARDETAPVEAGTRPGVGAADPVRSGDIAPTDPGNRPDMPPAG